MSIGHYEIGHGFDLPPLFEQGQKTAILLRPGISYEFFFIIMMKNLVKHHQPKAGEDGDRATNACSG